VDCKNFLQSQGYNDIVIDGKLGSSTYTYWQKFLHKMGFYNDQFDGKFGAKSYTALQKFLNSENQDKADN